MFLARIHARHRSEYDKLNLTFHTFKVGRQFTRVAPDPCEAHGGLLNPAPCCRLCLWKGRLRIRPYDLTVCRLRHPSYSWLLSRPSADSRLSIRRGLLERRPGLSSTPQRTASATLPLTQAGLFSAASYLGFLTGPWPPFSSASFSSPLFS